MSSFVQFYTNDKQIGHGLVKPSIDVANAMGRLFRPLGRREGCCEVLSRTIQMIGLVVLGILSLVPAIIGIFFKGLSSCCCPPTEPIEIQMEPVPEDFLD